MEAHLAPDVMPKRKQSAERLASAINTLPGRYRKALWLHYIENRPYPEVIAMLGVPSGTVKTWLHRGRHLVRDNVEDLIRCSA